MREFVGISTAVQPIQVHWCNSTVTVILGHILNTESFSHVLLIIIVLDAEIFVNIHIRFSYREPLLTVAHLMRYKFYQLFHTRYTHLHVANSICIGSSLLFTPLLKHVIVK